MGTEVTENRILTQMMLDTFDTEYQIRSVGDMVRSSRKERFLFLCDSSNGKIHAIRAQHGMSKSIGVHISVCHARFPCAALKDAPYFFHMSPAAKLPLLTQSSRSSSSSSLNNLLILFLISDFLSKPPFQLFWLT